MDRIYPQNIDDITSIDWSNPRSKSQWAYGYGRPVLGFGELIYTLKDEMADESFLWYGTNILGQDIEKSFAEIVIINPKYGFFHMIEYFPFNNEHVTFKNKKNDIECLRNFDSNGNLKSPKPINDKPLDRLNLYSDKIANKCFEPKSNDIKKFKENNISKHLIFGSLTREEGKKYFNTKEKNTFFYGHEDIDEMIERIKRIPSSNIDSWSTDKLKVVEKLCLPTLKKADINVPTKLSKQQLKHVNRSRKDKIMELKGIAGSGKTFVLANRALRLASENQRVLMTFYTKDFKSHFNHVLKRPNPYSYYTAIDNLQTIEVENIHKYMAKILRRMKDVGFFDGPIGPPLSFAKKILRAIEKHKDFHEKITRGSGLYFDAILIDEGQNWDPEWVEVLEKFSQKLSKSKNLMIAYDHNQCLYRGALAYSLQLNKGGIEDPLLGAYRIPDTLFRKINRVRQFISEGIFEIQLDKISYYVPEQYDIKFESEGEFEWLNTYNNEDSVGSRIKNVTLKIIKKIEEKSMLPGDCVILVEDHIYAAKIQQILKENSIEFVSITDSKEILNLDSNWVKNDEITLLVKDRGNSSWSNGQVLKEKLTEVQYEKNDLSKTFYKGKTKFLKAYDWSLNQLSTRRLTSQADHMNNNLKEEYKDSLHGSGFESEKIITHTIKSFQGQEIPHVFVFLSSKDSNNKPTQSKDKTNWNTRHTINQLFVALTRARRSVYVYNDNEELNEIKDIFNRDD